MINILSAKNSIKSSQLNIINMTKNTENFYTLKKRNYSTSNKLKDRPLTIHLSAKKCMDIRGI